MPAASRASSQSSRSIKKVGSTTKLPSFHTDEQPILPADNELKRGLKARHLSMISIAGTIGTGLFLASGSSIAQAGPLGALIAYIMIGSMVFFMMTSLGEMATLIPTAGSFNTYAARFVDPALGFALGINYFLNWAVTVAVEIAAAAMILEFWVSPSVLPGWVWSLIFLFIMVFVNFLSVRAYGEAEYWFSVIKVLTVVIFIIVGVLVDAGVIGGHKIGFSNWTIPGAPVVDGFGGILAVFLVAGFSFQGTELIGIAAGESENPRKNVPKAIKQVFWRILLFYIISIFIIGLVIPHDDPNLLNSGSVDKSAIAVSPFTLVLQKAFQPASHIMNAVILITVLSAGNSGMYASTRTLLMLARDGKAPAIFSRVNSRGIPMPALICTTVISAICFCMSLFGSGQVYNWLLNISSISGFIAWLGIAISHYRFRRAYVAQGGDVSRLPYKAAMFPYGPIYALLLCTVVVCGQGYSEFTKPNPQAVNLVACYIGLPFFLFTYLGYKFYYKTKLVPLMECDFSVSNLEDGDIDEFHELYEPSKNQADEKDQ
ncbi:amino acid permease [Gamsiella multidivaricata]|uniref:amino acid permease n=1 Tax=Gamsiella multidivaricata TaxID=101098 RepID=UPI00222109FD|nr:amino acid permease [Gamsiella multidivaricata]KAI7832574.1 amino acid permease [Gamsiella multidivaricata]